MRELRVIDSSRVRAVLCDADGTLFPSEEPAFAASALVTQEFAGRFGLQGDFSPEHLRLTTTGKNFRTTSGDLLRGAGVTADPMELDRWVEKEKAEVTAHLASTLKPQPDVLAVLCALHDRHDLAAVSSSALTRLAACFSATGLDDLIPSAKRFSAEDSLPTPTGKPDPAVYELALARLGIGADQAVAIEDSPSGAASAVAAGIPTIGLLQYVPRRERDQRAVDLRDSGVAVAAETWDEVAMILGVSARTARR
jgi:beta-phosphoglucomutase-like phosphatase (HAD superfamily)